MLKTRIIAALIFAPALLGIVVWGGLPLALLCLVLAWLMLWEFFRLTLGKGELYLKTVGFLLCTAVVLQMLEILPATTLNLLLPIGVILLFGTVLAQPEPLEGSIHRVGFLAVGVVYCGALIPFLARLRGLEDGLGFAVMALFCTWAADTFAYFAGRLFGRHKLYPRVSPGKTIEGGIGGLLGAVVMAFGIRELLGVQISLLQTIAIGSITAVFGAVGDLCESMLKRSVGAKDSSNLIPGHGGVLDRFDAAIFVAPALYAYVVLFALGSD